MLSTGLFVSNDGGQKFRAIGGGIHPDHHALWIDPGNPLHLIEGNDGGIDISYDLGKTWLPVQNIDAAEVYQVGYDLRQPYFVYCGIQDNGSWGGPSATTDPLGIVNDDWVAIGGGDGFFAQPDPSDINTVYSNYQMNNVYRYDWRINKSRPIRPAARLDEPPYRFNWNSPIHISAHDSKTVFVGGNYLFKSTNRGIEWEIISPDLTTNDPEKQKDSGGPITPDNSGAEIHCTITTIAESPIEKGLIWCGTDDGNLQLTRDGGKTWANVVGHIKGLPRNTWCSRVEASHFEPGTAYAAFDGHRADDYAAYVYKTIDFGKTWKSIKGNLPFGWVHVIREDVKNRNLLFAGTEFSIFASLDGGATWFSLKNDLPTVAVHDIAVHSRDHDLIIGTHGRGIWILEDISYLQEMTPEVLANNVHLFNVRPVTEFYMATRRESFTKPAFAAKNPLYGMAVTIYLKSKPKERPKVSLIGSGNEPVFEFELDIKEGIQRDYWSLQVAPKTKDGKKIPPSGIGLVALPLVAPGDFVLQLTVDGQEFQTPAAVRPDPRLQMTVADREAQNQTLAELLAIAKKMGLCVTAATSIRRQIDTLNQDLKKEGSTIEAVVAAIKTFEERFRPLEEDVVPKDFGGVPSTQESALRGGSLNMQLLSLGAAINGYPEAPTKTEERLLTELGGKVEALVERVNQVIRGDLPGLNKVLEENKKSPLKVPAEVKL